MVSIAVVGSREYPDETTVRAVVRGFPKSTMVISGGARGVDTWAIEEAQRCGLQTKVFPADWEYHGKRAGYLRNKDVVAAADKIVAFWDGKSRGTKHTIDLAKEAGKPVAIMRA